MAISAEIIPLCALRDNYIWTIIDRAADTAYVVDPGDAAPIFKVLEQYNLSLSGILITHHHHDHSGGVLDLLHQYPAIPVYGSHRSPLPFITHHVKEGDEIALADIILKAIEIPGHTLDHTAYVGNNWLFSGDTLFSMGCGKIFEGTPEQMYHSLQKLAALPPDTKVFCGHEYTLANLAFAKHVEPDNAFIKEKIKQMNELIAVGKPTLPSTMAEENKLNPFLRCADPPIIQAVENYAKQTLTNPVKVFAVLREWKNHFKLKGLSKTK